MNRPQLYFETSNILIEAYKNQTLFHNTAWICAVANIIAVRKGCTVVPYEMSKHGIHSNWEKENNPLRFKESDWHEMLSAPTRFHRLLLAFKLGWGQYKVQKKNLKLTGYSIIELKRIMAAFDIFYDDADVTKNIIPALRNVLRVLKDLHRVKPLDIQINYHVSFALEQSNLAALPAEYEWVKRAATFYNYTYRQYIADKKREAEATLPNKADLNQLLLAGQAKLEFLYAEFA